MRLEYFAWVGGLFNDVPPPLPESLPVRLYDIRIPLRAFQRACHLLSEHLVLRTLQHFCETHSIEMISFDSQMSRDRVATLRINTNDHEAAALVGFLEEEFGWRATIEDVLAEKPTVFACNIPDGFDSDV